jgi:hypothetical protein
VFIENVVGSGLVILRKLLTESPPAGMLKSLPGNPPTAATETTKASHLQQCDRTASQKV